MGTISAACIYIVCRLELSYTLLDSYTEGYGSVLFDQELHWSQISYVPLFPVRATYKVHDHVVTTTTASPIPKMPRHRRNGRRARYSSRFARMAEMDDQMTFNRRTVSYTCGQCPTPYTARSQYQSSQHGQAQVNDEPELLHVTAVDLAVPFNTKDHHTAEYDITDAAQNDGKVSHLVVRRGQPFETVITFNRPYDNQEDDLRLTFRFGKCPIVSKGSHVVFILSEKDEPKEWGALIKSRDGNSLRLKVMTPPTTMVGKWKLSIDVVKKAYTGVTVYRYDHPDVMYMLFNPWCKDDQVYMPDERLLNEYILNETGKIYSGSYKQITSKPWNFGQFTDEILECCLYLLENSGMGDRLRGDPVQVSRKLSALVNSSDDDGVLTGNWSGDYQRGTSPLAWSGSVEILTRYYKTKQPVQFGQCWVFSGVLTTVCRALGIPARSVTNFASAHDTDGSITIDEHYDADGNPLDNMNDDSVWNFHVWNDVWMARPELPKGYGGWQAIDSTPQETSDHVFCMGPMSLVAIKRGDVSMPFDGPFVFAEVNADKLFWKLDADGEMKNVHKQTNRVGKCISTKRPKMVGSREDREDVTDQYKFPDDSEEGRAAVLRANMHSEKPGMYDTGPKDVEFELVVYEDTMYGDTVKIELKIKNTSSDKRQVNGRITLSSMYYTGVHYKNAGNVKITDETISPAETSVVNLEVPVDKYLETIMDHCIFRVSCVCFVTETKQNFFELEELRLRKPHLTIKAPDSRLVGEKIGVEVSFVNPLHVALNKCELHVEGPGLLAPVVYKQKNVGANKTFVGTFEMTPKKKGEREIVVSFNCNHIQAVTGSHVINVQ